MLQFLTVKKGCRFEQKYAGSKLKVLAGIVKKRLGKKGLLRYKINLPEKKFCCAKKWMCLNIRSNRVAILQVVRTKKN